jgi:hypothetical protein
MRITPKSAAPLLLLAAAALALGGCSHHDDRATVGRYGGYTTTGYDGPLAEIPPVAAVDFSTQRHVVTDDDLEEMFPALQRLSPRRICLGGQKVSDRSVDLLSRLPYLRVVNLEGTNVTPAGWARLRLSHWD